MNEKEYQFAIICYWNSIISSENVNVGIAYSHRGEVKVKFTKKLERIRSFFKSDFDSEEFEAISQLLATTIELQGEKALSKDPATPLPEICNQIMNSVYLKFGCMSIGAGTLLGTDTIENRIEVIMHDYIEKHA